MIKIKHIPLLDAFSVLLFSLLASFIFELKIDFDQQVDYVIIGKLFCLTSASFIFYITVNRLKKSQLYAEHVVSSENSLEDAKKHDVDKLFKDRYRQDRFVTWGFTLTLLLVIIFFFLQPVLKLLNTRH